MAARVGLWRIREDGPHPIEPVAMGLERELEDWIEENPDLLQPGLTIVGRQIHTAGGPLDLLALDTQGRWVVVELKRTSLTRDVVAQALDYASCIATMPMAQLQAEADRYLRATDPTGRTSLESLLVERQGELDQHEGRREVDLIVAGTAREPSLDRIVDFLAPAGTLSVRVVSFQVFELEDESRVLVREITDSDEIPVQGAARAGTAVSTKEVLERADAHGSGHVVRRILDTAERLGLPHRPWKTSLMFSPPGNRRICLFTVWVDTRPDGLLGLAIVPEAFEEYFGLEQDAVLPALGIKNPRVLDPKQVDTFVENLEKLLGEA